MICVDGRASSLTPTTLGPRSSWRLGRRGLPATACETPAGRRYISSSGRNGELKHLVADLSLEVYRLKKTSIPMPSVARRHGVGDHLAQPCLCATRTPRKPPGCSCLPPLPPCGPADTRPLDTSMPPSIGLDFKPMNDGGRYSIQSPILSNLPPTRPTSTPPFTHPQANCIVYQLRDPLLRALPLAIKLFRSKRLRNQHATMTSGFTTAPMQPFFTRALRVMPEALHNHQAAPSRSDHGRMSTQRRRYYTPADLALLWSRSGGLCGFPECPVICVEPAQRQ